MYDTCREVINWARKIRIEVESRTTHANSGIHRSDLVAVWAALDELLIPDLLSTLDETARQELMKHLNFCIVEESGTNINDNSKDVYKVHVDLLENWATFQQILNGCLANCGFHQTVGVEELKVFPVVTLGIVLSKNNETTQTFC